MTYITNDDIQERIGAAALLHLADDNNDGVFDAGIVEEARLGAEGEMNAYLARRYQTPIDTSAHPELADVLAAVALDLAEYRLRLRRPPVPADVLRRYDRTVQWLKAVSEGRLSLPAASEVSASAASGIVSVSLGEPRVLSRHGMELH